MIEIYTIDGDVTAKDHGSRISTRPCVVDGAVFISQAEAARQLGVDAQPLNYALRNRKRMKGVSVRYATTEEALRLPGTVRAEHLDTQRRPTSPRRGFDAAQAAIAVLSDECTPPEARIAAAIAILGVSAQ